MANRKVGNIWIIDTVGNLATQPATGRAPLKINAVGFYSLDSTAHVQVVLVSNTANCILDLQTNVNSPNTEIYPVGATYYDEVNIKVATAGTAWLYLA